MLLIINGKEITFKENIKIKDIYSYLEINPVGTAVEVNRNIIPKSDFEQFTLKNGDVVEIIKFVGGG